MLPIRTILHPTDFSACSAHAFGVACLVAREYNARVVILHVAPLPVVFGAEGVFPPLSEDLADQLREQFDHQVPADPRVAVERRLAEGDPAREILRAADEFRCDLIVMGTHGRTGVGRLVLGSVAEHVMRGAPCPVLTVKVPPGPVAAARASVARTNEPVGVPV